jgi:hypothetical protein
MLGILPMLWTLNLSSAKAVEAENGDSSTLISFICFTSHAQEEETESERKKNIGGNSIEGRRMEWIGASRQQRRHAWNTY